MPVAAKPKCLGHVAIGPSEAIVGDLAVQALRPAIERLNLPAVEMTIAVIGAVTAAIGGDEQRIVPIVVKKRRQRVRLVVIEKEQLGVGPESDCRA